MRGVLTGRDKEMLRTLLRVQLANTASLQQAFFPSLRPTQRRLQVLRGRGLIKHHSKGLPGGSGVRGSAYWRLTTAGLETVAECFPDEPLPDNAVERAAQGSLRFFEHRDRVADLYLALIRDRHQDAVEMTRRASSFRWAPEYQVVLHYSTMSNKRRIVPDATLTSSTARFFLEIDRSTESRSRCKRAVEAYSRFVRWHYDERFPDGLPPYLVYVTKSNTRCESLYKAFGPIASASLEVVVLAFPDAIRWLRQGLYGDDVVAIAPPDPREEGGDSDGAFRKQAIDHMGRLYNAYRDELERRAHAGEAATAPPWLAEVYDFMRQHYPR